MGIYNFRRVEGNIYRGGVPDFDDLKMLHDVYKIKRIISLDESAGGALDQKIKELGMDHMILPINSTSTILSDSIRFLIRNVVRLLEEKQPVFVHCLHGADRTGLVIAMYRVLHDNYSCENALSEARRYQFGMRISPAVQEFYKNILCLMAQKVPVAAADDGMVDDKDIVERERGELTQNKPPAFNPQQSFAPFVSQPQYNRRLERSQMLWDMCDAYDIPREEDNLVPPAEEIPEVGLHSNYGPSRGFGPVENSGMLQNI